MVLQQSLEARPRHAGADFVTSWTARQATLLSTTNKRGFQRGQRAGSQIWEQRTLML